MKIDGPSKLPAKEEAITGRSVTSDRGEKTVSKTEIQDTEKEISIAQLQEAVDKLNLAVTLFNHNVQFRIINNNQTTLVQVMEKDGDNVIYQMPPYKLFTIISKLNDTFNGLLVDEKA